MDALNIVEKTVSYTTRNGIEVFSHFKTRLADGRLVEIGKGLPSPDCRSERGYILADPALFPSYRPGAVVESFSSGGTGQLHEIVSAEPRENCIVLEMKPLLRFVLPEGFWVPWLSD